MTDKVNSVESTRDRAAIDALRRALENSDKREMLSLFAAHRKAQLDAYIAAGFTREEAFAFVLQAAAE